jgi:hypothetical protein
MLNEKAPAKVGALCDWPRTLPLVQGRQAANIAARKTVPPAA